MVSMVVQGTISIPFYNGNYLSKYIKVPLYSPWPHIMPIVPYSRKYWREFKILAVESQIAITNILARFKFGGSVQDHHTIICMGEILADIIWRLGG